MSKGYIALRSMKVQACDEQGETIRDPKTGRPKIREVKRGEELPEARHWPRVENELKAGRIALADSPSGEQAIADLKVRSAPRPTPAKAKAAADAPAAQVKASSASSPPAARTEGSGAGKAPAPESSKPSAAAKK